MSSTPSEIRIVYPQDGAVWSLEDPLALVCDQQIHPGTPEAAAQVARVDTRPANVSTWSKGPEQAWTAQSPSWTPDPIALEQTGKTFFRVAILDSFGSVVLLSAPIRLRVIETMPSVSDARLEESEVALGGTGSGVPPSPDSSGAAASLEGIAGELANRTVLLRSDLELLVQEVSNLRGLLSMMFSWLDDLYKATDSLPPNDLSELVRQKKDGTRR